MDKYREYIGSTSNIRKRFKMYKNISCKTQIRLYRSLLKYGVDLHTFEVIEEPTLDAILEREAYWGAYYDVLGKRGLNCRLPKGTDTYKTVSDETRRKMSEGNKGKVRSEQHKEAVRSANKGKTLSDEHKKIISNAHKGKIISAETRLKLSENNKTSKIVLDTATGIYYNSVREASESTIYGKGYLAQMLRGKHKNKTNLKYI